VTPRGSTKSAEREDVRSEGRGASDEDVPTDEQSLTGAISVREANRLDLEEFVRTLGSVYEHSPWVAERAWRESPFEGPEDLRRALWRAVDEAPRGRQLDLIRAHPDLAGKAAVAGELTPESEREQSSAGLDRLSPEEYERFTDVNTAYRERFGFPMVVYVREHTKDSILAQAEARLANTREREVGTALEEIRKIAASRLEELIVSEGEGGRR
jgi:2-oxo-4-hydroxy-4-carboxy-5-ureidoimidazoline decarboxylase